MPPMLGNLIKDFPEWGEHTNGIAQYSSKSPLLPSPFVPPLTIGPFSFFP